MHQTAAETHAAAETLTAFGLLKASKERSAKILGEGGTRRLSDFSGDVRDFNGGRALLS